MEDKKQNKTRYPLIDFLRGVAIIWMVIFHLAYDLDKFRFVNIDFQTDPFWYPFPRAIVFLFLICVGMGLGIVHKKEVKWKSAWNRFLKIGLWAVVISIMTYFLFPGHWVFFGTLHCIALTSLVGVYFVRWPRFSLIAGIIIITQHLYFKWTWLNWYEIMKVKPMDYIPFYPWMAVVLIGIGLHHYGIHKFNSKFFETKVATFTSWLGKHSLKIYLTHQIILFSLVWAIAKLINLGQKWG